MELVIELNPEFLRNVSWIERIKKLTECSFDYFERRPIESYSRSERNSVQSCWKMILNLPGKQPCGESDIC